MKKPLIFIASLLLALIFTSCASDSSAPTQGTQTNTSTESSIDASHPIVLLKTTAGNLEIELFPDVAPLAVENFMTHIKNGYYNKVAFHRIIKDFMIQGGDPTETGRGGESIWKKDFKDEFTDKTFDKPGILAMANRGPYTNGSQFFITTAPTPWLNGHHTIFGQLTPSSYAVLSKLNNTPVNGSTPKNRVEIIKASIVSEGK